MQIQYLRLCFVLEFCFQFTDLMCPLHRNIEPLRRYTVLCLTLLWLTGIPQQGGVWESYYIIQAAENSEEQ